MDPPKTEPEIWNSTLRSGAQSCQSQMLCQEAQRHQPSLHTQLCAPAHVCTPGKGKGLGASGRGSWLKTESLEEQVLLASPPEGE
jgi:hypothetical protein